MNSRERFLAACRSEPLDRPPFWVMRQAGRYLPEYRELKTRYTFHDLVKTPELAVEVTMQPIRRYALDAAIIFSDILVIPEALGQPYHFRDRGGIKMEFRLESDEDVARLEVDGIEERLAYVPAALRGLRETMGRERAIIGFAGSPWTLATYMIEGQSSKDYIRSRAWMYEAPERFEALLETITEALIRYFRMQLAAGVDAVQIFDSWGGVLPPHHFRSASIDWIKRVVDAVGGEVPVIVYSKGMHEHTEALVSTGAQILGVGWNTSIAKFWDALPEGVGVQGNLDPAVMSTAPAIVEREAKRVLAEMGSRPGFIFNLGHGITPSAKPECMAALAETITSWRAEGA